MANVNISGLSKAAVLAVLYNASRAQGMGFLQRDSKPMTEDEAAEILSKTTYFDYLGGRVMKISLDSDSLDAYLYDRDNGHGAAERVVSELRKPDTGGK